MSDEDDVPAFPESVAVDHMDGVNYSRHPGMSLRDYFAAQALVLFASEEMMRTMAKIAADRQAGSSVTLMATYAYEIADAMLSERAK